MQGHRIEEYELFPYDWLYTNVHKITDHARRVLRDIVDTGNFDFYRSPFLDAKVQKAASRFCHKNS